MRFADLAIRVRVAHERRADGHPQAPRDEVRRPDEDRRIQVVRVPIRSKKGSDAGVIAPGGRLVPADHGARILHRRARDGRSEHRLAQDVPRIECAAAAQHVLGVRESRHLFQVRTRDAPAIRADGTHHLQLFVDDHEELFGLFRVLEERGEGFRSRAASGVTERARDGVHRDDAAAGADVRLGTCAHRDVARRDDREGPVRPAFVLEQRAEPGQRGLARIGVYAGGEVAADDEIRSLTASDLVGDDVAHDLGVILVGDVEPGVVQRHGCGRQDAHRFVSRQGAALGDDDATKRCSIVVAFEPALPHLTVRNQREDLLRGSLRVDQRDIGKQLDIHDGPREDLDIGAITRDQDEGTILRGVAQALQQLAAIRITGGAMAGHRGSFGSARRGGHSTKRPPRRAVWIRGNANTPPRRRATRNGSRTCRHDSTRLPVPRD